MGRPLGSKNKTDEEKNPMTEQARGVSGFSSMEAVEGAAPASTMSDAPTTQEPGKKPTSVRTPKTAKEVDPNMLDPRYKQAVANMTAGSTQKLIGAPFEVWAWVAKDPELALSEEEQKEWADVMYVASKKMNLDPTSPRFLFFYSILLLGKQSMTRVVKQFKKKGVQLPPEVEKIVNDLGGNDTGETPVVVEAEKNPAPAPATVDPLQDAFTEH